MRMCVCVCVRTFKCICMVVSRCRGLGPPSGIPSSGLCFCWPPTTSSSNARPPVSQFLLFVLVWPVPRGVFVIPRAGFLVCFYKSIYRHLGNTLPVLRSNTCVQIFSKSVIRRISPGNVVRILRAPPSDIVAPFTAGASLFTAVTAPPPPPPGTSAPPTGTSTEVRPPCCIIAEECPPCGILNARAPLRPPTDISARCGAPPGIRGGTPGSGAPPDGIEGAPPGGMEGGPPGGTGAGTPAPRGPPPPGGMGWLGRGCGGCCAAASAALEVVVESVGGGDS